MQDVTRDPNGLERELAEALEIEESVLSELLHYDSDPVSLDAAVGEDGDTSLGDLVVNHSAQSPFETVALAAFLAGDGHSHFVAQRRTAVATPR